MRYKARAINAPSGLSMRVQPNVSANIQSNLPNNGTFIAIDTSISMDGTVWFKDEETSLWVPYRQNGRTYLKIVADLTPSARATARRVLTTGLVGAAFKVAEDIIESSEESTTPAELREGITDRYAMVAEGTKLITIGSELNDPSPEVVYARDARLQVLNNSTKPYVNSNNYPPHIKNERTGLYTYNYFMDLSDIAEAMNDIKRDMNIPFGDIYTLPKINKLMHTQFNRFRIQYPDYERQRLIPYVFFTRPDLNLYVSGSTKHTESLKANPQLDYLVASNPLTARSLTLEYTSEHVLNPLLCNRVASFDTSDDTLEVGESGETFTGYKLKIAKNTVKSTTGGSLNIKFPETYNLAITTMHQIWVGYENAVYRGLMEPQQKYITGKILDYACDIFYFLADSEGVIRFWSQIFGALPTNVNKSVFSYDEGSLVSFPSVSITYEYFRRKDWEPDTIVDFNIAAGMNSDSAVKMTGQEGQPRFPYLVDYVPALGHSGRTWSGPPFIEPFLEDDGSGKMVQRFRLRFRPATNDV